MVTGCFSHLTEVSNQRIGLATIPRDEIQNLSYPADLLLFPPLKSFPQDSRQFYRIARRSNDGILLPEVRDLELYKALLIQILDGSHQSGSILLHLLRCFSQIQRVP